MRASYIVGAATGDFAPASESAELAGAPQEFKISPMRPSTGTCCVNAVSTGKNTTVRSAMGRNATAKPRNEKRVEMQFVLSFRVFPVIPQNTRATSDSSSQVLISETLDVQRMEVTFPPQGADAIDILFQIALLAPSRWSGTHWRPIGFGLVKLVMLPGSPVFGSGKDGPNA